VNKRYLQAATVAVVLSLASAAFADKVAVLPLQSGSGVTSVELEAALKATRAAVTALNHRLPTDSEMLTAQMSVKDGVADTGEEYKGAGKASTSDWTVTGQVDGHGPTYRLELNVCQIESGRIESLAREITPADAPRQIGEMLALMLRPEGLANAPIPWERNLPPPPSPPAPAPAPTPAPPVQPPAPVEPPVRHAYAEEHPFALGVFTSVLGAISRPSDATGSSTAALVGGTVAYAFASAPGLELKADVAFSVAGPGSISADGGLRYAIPIAPSLRLFIGPEAEVGGFFASGADKIPRALLQAGAFASLGVGAHLQLEIVGDVAYAAGSPSLALGGGGFRGLVRF
jgi:hypothetical protein